MRKIIKQLKKKIAQQFTDFVRSLYSGKISEESAQIYLDNMPNYFEVLDAYKEKQARDAHEKSYKEIIGNKDKILADELKKKAEEVVALLNEEIDMTERNYSFENKKGLEKYNKLRKLAQQKQQAETTCVILGELVKKFTPEKRGPGRTRKDGSPARSKKLQQLEGGIKQNSEDQQPPVPSQQQTKGKVVKPNTAQDNQGELEGQSPQEKNKSTTLEGQSPQEKRQQQTTPQDDALGDTQQEVKPKQDKAKGVSPKQLTVKPPSNAPAPNLEGLDDEDYENCDKE